MPVQPVTSNLSASNRIFDAGRRRAAANRWARMQPATRRANAAGNHPSVVKAIGVRCAYGRMAQRRVAELFLPADVVQQAGGDEHVKFTPSSWEAISRAMYNTR